MKKKYNNNKNLCAKKYFVKIKKIPLGSTKYVGTLNFKINNIKNIKEIYHTITHCLLDK